MTKETKKYPFNEGDDYWTVETVKFTDKGQELEAVWSCWDFISEELFDENPDRLLFATEQEAIDYLSKKKANLETT